MFFWSDDFYEPFSEKIGLENVPEQYGGRLPNKLTNFFPPELNIQKPVIMDEL